MEKIALRNYETMKDLTAASDDLEKEDRINEVRKSLKGVEGWANERGMLS